MQVIEVLNKAGFESRLVGGCVRDKILSIEPQDYDIATIATPDQVIEIFKKHFFFSVIPTGLQHGTVTITKNHESVEVTTLRVDKFCDGRHAEIEFTDSFELDAARRDFTINAMYEDLHGNIYDYFGGQEDLVTNTLKFVGNPMDRIQEDYLRIMRYFRFLARFNMQATPASCFAISQLKEGLRKISQERITSELLKILKANPSTMHFMWELGILDIILPEHDAENIQNLGVTTNPIVRLANALPCNTSPKDVEILGKRLKLSSIEIKQLAFALVPIKPNLEQADYLDMADRVEELVGHADIYSLNKTKSHTKGQGPQDYLRANILHGDLRTKTIPISSEKIMKTLGMKSGKELGTLLKILKRAYRNGIWKSEEQALQLIRIMTYDIDKIPLFLIDPIQAKRDIAKLRMDQLNESD
jgi:tRNA nucleotidyltransferase/poly(A) polymerase